MASLHSHNCGSGVQQLGSSVLRSFSPRSLVLNCRSELPHPPRSQPSYSTTQNTNPVPANLLKTSHLGVASCSKSDRQSPVTKFSERQVSASVIDTSNRGPVASTSRPRLRIAVDVDEVLGRFVYTLNAFCKEHYGMDYQVADYWIYEFAKIWGCNQERSNHIVHEFFKSQHFNDGIPVIPGAFEALTRMKTTHDLVVVTSRQHVIQDITLEWLDTHFSGLFQEVYFGNHFALEGKSRKKSEICKSIQAQVLIDDNPSYAMECAAAGIHVLLYDWREEYAWSKLPAGYAHELITIVRDWEEVEVAIAALAAKVQQ